MRLAVFFALFLFYSAVAVGAPTEASFSLTGFVKYESSGSAIPGASVLVEVYSTVHAGGFSVGNVFSFVNSIASRLSFAVGNPVVTRCASEELAGDLLWNKTFARVAGDDGWFDVLISGVGDNGKALEFGLNKDYYLALLTSRDGVNWEQVDLSPLREDSCVTLFTSLVGPGEDEVSNELLGINSVGSSELVDYSITSDDIFPKAVTEEKLEASSVYADAVQEGAVSSDSILDNSLMNADFSPDAKISCTKFASCTWGGASDLDADMVDGIHASSTASANKLYPLGNNKKIPNSVLKTGHGNGLDADTVDGEHADKFAPAALSPAYYSACVRDVVRGSDVHYIDPINVSWKDDCKNFCSVSMGVPGVFETALIDFSDPFSWRKYSFLPGPPFHPPTVRTFYKLEYKFPSPGLDVDSCKLELQTDGSLKFFIDTGGSGPCAMTICT